MRKHILLIIALLLLCMGGNAQKLVFNNDQLFKIVQFTDMHYEHGNPKSDTTLLTYKRVLDAEKPDLIIFTGDIVTAQPVVEGWDAITKYVIDLST